MNEAGRGGTVCGFGDVAAGLGGLAWEIGEPGALLLGRGQARPATFAIEEGGDAATLAISAGDDTVEATLIPRSAELALADGPTVTPCSAEVRSVGGNQTFRCSGEIARWSGDPLEGAAVFRQLTVDGGDDTLLVGTAKGEPGVEGHGDETTLGWRIDAEQATPFEESLISTQYAAGGDPTRIGLELWPRDADQASRAGAVRVAGSLLGGVRMGGTWAGLFRCHTDGAEGLGTYLLWRA